MRAHTARSDGEIVPPRLAGRAQAVSRSAGPCAGPLGAVAIALGLGAAVFSVPGVRPAVLTAGPAPGRGP